MANLGIAAEDRVYFPRLRHRRQVDRELRESARSGYPTRPFGGRRLSLGRANRARCFGASRGHRGEVALEGIGRNPQQLARSFARPARQDLVRQQCPQQMTGAHPRQAMLDRGHQPRLFGEIYDLRRQGWRPGIAGLHAVERAVEVDREPRLVHLVVTQDRRDVAIRGIGQLYEPMLDLDIVVGAREGEARGGLEGAPARLVQPSHQCFKINRGHLFSRLRPA